MTNGFTLELSSNGTLSGNNIKAGYPIVEVADGKLSVVAGGSIIEPYNPEAPKVYTTTTVAPDAALNSDRPVKLTSDDSHFSMTGGTVEGEITCEAANADIQILGGTVKWVEGYQATTRSDILINPNTCSSIYTDKDKKVYLNAAINDSLYVSYSGYLSAGDCIMGGNGYSITQADVDRLSLKYAFWYHYDYPSIEPVYSPAYSRKPIPPGYSFINIRIPYKLVLRDNKVYLEELPNPVRTIEDVEPGTLPSRIPAADRELIEELTITGKLNGTDIKLIREMACKKLKKLDISECRIVEGGELYGLSYTPSVQEIKAYKHASSTPDVVTLGYHTTDDVIGKYMFAGLTSLKYIVLPNNVSSIETGAFMDCPNIETLVFGQIEKIETGLLFAGSNKLMNLTTNSSSYISNKGVLYYNGSTIAAVLPSAANGTFKIAEGVDSIAPYTFTGYDNLSLVVLPSSLTHVSDYAFCRSGLTSITIPETVKFIGDGSFMGCSKLNKVDFPLGLEEMGSGAFYGCDISNIDLSSTIVKKIAGDGHTYPIAAQGISYSYGLGVFEDNNNILSIRLPSTIEEIGGKAFTSPQIRDIYCQSLPPVIWYNYTYVPGQTQIGGYGFAVSDTFSDIYSTCRLHVPANTVTLYKEANGWKIFSNIIGDQEAIANPYSNITTEDDLQKVLDEIAAQRPSEPVEVTISPDGITLTKGIWVNTLCKAVITGGPINVVGNGNGHFTDDAMFYVLSSAILAFHDIKFDFNYCNLNAEAFWIRSGGHLYMRSGVEYQNVADNIIGSWGIAGAFYYNGGSLYLESGKLPKISGAVLNNFGQPVTTLQQAMLNGDLFDNPIVYNNAGSRIVFNSAVKSLWTFEGDWANYTLEQAFISGTSDYELAASDYWQMRFEGLPSNEFNRTVYYDGSEHTIKLKSYKSLQGLMDGDDDGHVDVPCDGVDIGKDFTPSQRMQWVLDGSNCPNHIVEPPTIWMPGGCMFLDYPTEVKNITFNSFSSGHRLYIRNKTEFKNKVVARNFLVFSIIEQGGNLIWENAETENVLYPIYNNGGIADIRGGKLGGTIYNSGTFILCGCVQVNEIQAHPQGVIRVTSPITSTWTIDLTFDSAVNYPNDFVIIEGGNGYTLTEADYSMIKLKLPAGCTATFDMTRKAVILSSTSDINEVKAGTETTHFYYSIDGRKLEGQPTKKGIYIVNGRKVIMK